MKRHFLLFIIALILAPTANAQSLLTVNGNQVDELFIHLNWNTWLNPPSNLEFEPARHRGITLGTMFRLDGGENKFGIAPGIAFSNTNVHTNAMSWSFNEQQEIEHVHDNKDYRKNKISLSYLEIPLEFQYRFKKDDYSTVKMAAGFKGGYLVDAHTKLKEGNGNKFKSKFREPFNDFRYGPYFRIGYKRYFLYGYYGLSNVFDDGNAPNTNPLSIGLVLSGI